jgi:hypothetical protein
VNVSRTQDSATCSDCGAQAERAVAVSIDSATATLCGDCASAVVDQIQNKLSLLSRSTPTQQATTAELVANFATYPLYALLDELVMCTLRYNVGPLDADDRQVVVALLERLAAFGVAQKMHRPGCEIWAGRRLCLCTWKVPS